MDTPANDRAANGAHEVNSALGGRARLLAPGSK